MGHQWSGLPFGMVTSLLRLVFSGILMAIWPGDAKGILAWGYGGGSNLDNL